MKRSPEFWGNPKYVGNAALLWGIQARRDHLSGGGKAAPTALGTCWLQAAGSEQGHCWLLGLCSLGPAPTNTAPRKPRQSASHSGSLPVFHCDSLKTRLMAPLGTAASPWPASRFTLQRVCPGQTDTEGNSFLNSVNKKHGEALNTLWKIDHWSEAEAGETATFLPSFTGSGDPPGRVFSASAPSWGCPCPQLHPQAGRPPLQTNIPSTEW